MNPRSRRSLLIAAIAGAVVLAAWLVRPRWIVHATVGQSIPARPDLGALPPVFSDLVARTETAARRYSQAIFALAELGKLYHANAFYAQANQCYDGLMKLEPGDPRWPYLKANSLAGFGQLLEAKPLLQRTIELAPDYLPARLRLADALRKTDNSADASEAYAAVLKREPTNGYAMLGLALCDLDNGDWAAAKNHLQQSVAAHPGFFGGWSLLVTVHEHFGDAALAAAARREAKAAERYRDFPDPWLEELTDHCYQAYRLSVAAGGASTHATARRWLERAIALAPENGSYHRQLGAVLFKDRDYGGARRHLEKAVALDENDADGWALLVGLLAASGDFPSAEKVLATGLSHCPQSAPLHYENGQRLRSMGNLPEAITELELSKKLQPNDARAYVELALVYFNQGRTARGVAELKTAIAAEPGSPQATQLLARQSISSGNEANARSWIGELRKFPSSVNQDLNAILAEYAKRFGRDP